jgi:hypothetical protein
MHPAAHPDRRTVRRGVPGGPGTRRAAPGAGIAQWDLTTDEVHWSDEVFEIFGRDRASGALTLDQLPAHLLPDDQLPLQGMVTAALVDGRALAGEVRVVRPDGTVRTVHCTGEPVVGADGHAESLWLSLRDVSDRRPPVAAPIRPALRVQVAVRGPAEPGTGWCDALPLPGGRTALTAGSAAGAGDGCAALRDALRGMALAGAGPARMLRLLDALLPQYGMSSPVRAICCRCEPGGRPTLVWAQAGGAGPLLVRDGTVRAAAAGAAVDETADEVPAGPGGPFLVQHRIELVPGDVVLCWAGGPSDDEARRAVGTVARRISSTTDAADCAGLAFDLLTGAHPAGSPAGATGLLALRVA